MQAVELAEDLLLKADPLLKVAWRFVQLAPVLAGLVGYSLDCNSVVVDYSLVHIVGNSAAQFEDMLRRTAAVDGIANTEETDCSPRTAELHIADMVDQVEMSWLLAEMYWHLH